MAENIEEWIFPEEDLENVGVDFLEEKPHSDASHKTHIKLFTIAVVLFLLFSSVAFWYAALPKSAAGGEDNIVSIDSASLQPYLNQSLTWSDCVDGEGKVYQGEEGLRYECSDLKIPVNYENVEKSKSITIPLLRSIPENSTQELKTIVLNPGGPGGSGVVAVASGGLTSTELKMNNIIVGFDPRGVNGSESLKCFTSEEKFNYLTQPPPEDVKPEDGSEVLRKCTERADNELIKNLSSVEVVQDMNILRSALKQDKLNYLGFSYGTRLGLEYAQTFPSNVGKFVLDSVIDITKEPLERTLDQASNFQKSFEEFIVWCTNTETCTLGDNGQQIVENIIAVQNKLSETPAPTSDPDRSVNPNIYTSILLYSLYDEASWSTFITATDNINNLNDGGLALKMFDTYVGGDGTGEYDNSVENFQVVSCSDFLNTTQGQPNWTNDNFIQRLQQTTPDFIDFFKDTYTSCQGWENILTPSALPTTPVNELGEYWENPILLVANTRDPATPYVWAERIFNTYPDTAMVKVESFKKHVSYGANECVNEQVDGFFSGVKIPEPRDIITC